MLVPSLINFFILLKGHNIGGFYMHETSYKDPNNNFRTVMAYNCEGGCKRIQRFSTPDVKYEGKTLGTTESNNVEKINRNSAAVANFRVPETPMPSKHPTIAPTMPPTRAPTTKPTKAPTETPTKAPTSKPTDSPTSNPTRMPTPAPTISPTPVPTDLTDSTSPSCTDAPDGTTLNNESNFDCLWLRSKNERRRIKKCSRPDWQNLCRATCENC